jgi:hypothetical protein
VGIYGAIDHVVSKNFSYIRVLDTSVSAARTYIVVFSATIVQLLGPGHQARFVKLLVLGDGAIG